MKINFKELRINKAKVRKISKYALVIVIILVALILFPSTLSIYSSNGEASPEVDVAYSLLTVDKMYDEIRLKNVVPDGEERAFSFSVQNYDDKDNLIDVNMEYFVEVKTTTNLPMTYKLYYWDEVQKKDILVATNNEDSIITDSYEAKWFDFVSTTKVATFNSKVTDKYKLSYSLSTDYKNYEYQDISELIMIRINAKQVE